MGMTCEQEEQMLKNAFEKGIVRIPTDEIMIWNTADKIANEFAGGLCTREEIINAGLVAAENVDFWVYALHTDGGPDVIQLGTSPHERYISHKDKFGMPGWLNQIKDQHDWRQMDHVFAKRCEKKNPTYIPKDFTKEDEIYTKGKAKETENGQRCKDRNLKRQIDKKRQVMTCEEEEKMLEQAFEKGVIRIPVSELLDWNVAKKIADELAGGLCTKEDFIRADVKYPESFDHAA